MDDAPRVAIRSRAELRAWLQANHDRSSGVWLVTFKKHHPDYLPWGDLVAEALAFGWVDSRKRRVDEDRTCVWVCRRKPGSAWSGVNKRLVATLEAEGRMTPAGRAVIDAARASGSWSFLDDVEAGIVPDDLKHALEVARLQDAWTALPESTQRATLEWVKRAKRVTTRESRIAAIVHDLRAGRRPR